MKYKIELTSIDVHYEAYDWIISTNLKGKYEYYRGENYATKTITWIWEFSNSEDALMFRLKFG